MKKATLERKAIEINATVNRYFQLNPTVTEVKPGELMEYLVRTGVFNKDHRAGLPLRNILRGLDDADLLYLIPVLRCERKKKNRNWFFTTARHFTS